jgi:hypothetical protein
MATGSDRRSLDPFGVPMGVRMRNRKLCNTRSDRRSRDPLGSVIGVFWELCPVEATTIVQNFVLLLVEHVV